MQEAKEIVVETQKNAGKISLQQIHFVLYSFIKRILDIMLSLIIANFCKLRNKEKNNKK